MSDYPNSGALFSTKEKKHEKAPDMWGKIDLDRDYIRSLLESGNGLVTIKIDAWNRESAAGNQFLSIKVNTWKPTNQTEERMPEL
jgi:hypothetical protein